MASQLTDLIRKKYPGQYDDMDDATLEKAILTKYPDYKDLVTPPAEELELPSISPTEIQLKPGFGNAPQFKSVQDGSSTDSPIERGIVGQGWDAIKSGWDALSSPMIPKPASLKTVEDAYAEDNPISGNIGRFGTDMLYGSTSPLNLGLAATTGGTGIAARSGLQKTAQALRYGTKALSAPVAAEGAYHMATGDTWADRVLGGVELAGGVLGLKSKLPKIGESIKTGELPPVDSVSDLRSRMDKTTESPTLYHGTQNVFDKFDTSKNKLSGDFPGMIHFSEDPVRSELYSLGESKGMKRDGGLRGNPNTIPAKIKSGNVLDLTGKSVPVEQVQMLQQIFPELANTDPIRVADPYYIKDLINHYQVMGKNIKFPFDAIKYNEHGATNWAVNPSTEIKSTISGKSLNAAPEAIPEGVDPNTGEVLNEPIPERATSRTSGFGLTNSPGFTPPTQTSSIPQLSQNLKGGKPRYNIGQNSYEPQFESDIDKALFIIAQKNPSAQNAGYLKFVMDNLGVDEAEAVKLGREIRQKIKTHLSGQEPGQVKIPTIHQMNPSTQVPIAQTAGTPSGPPRKPPIKSSIISQGEDPTPEMNRLNTIGKFANESQKKSLWAEARDANRALLTAYDFSAPGRQGKPLLLTKAYWTSLDDMVKAWGTQRAADAVNDSIHFHPNFQRKVVNGKEMPSIADRAGVKIGGSEEMFQSNLADKFIPGVHRSSRAYSAFLGKLRADHLNNMIDDYAKSGIDITKDDVKLKALGDFINDATGKGNFGEYGKGTMGKVLNEAFFAPNLMASRVNMYKRWLDPRTYSNADPILRKQALKSLIATVGFGTAVGELAKLAGAEVSNDPKSSDFRKIKIGNTRIDPYSGFQQYAVGASRLLSGHMTSSKSGKDFDLTSGKFGMPSRASVVSQFAQNKLAPIPSLVWSWMEGTDWNGQPFELKKAMLDRTVPIVMQDLYELQKEDPKLLPLGILPIIGEGVQTYGR